MTPVASVLWILGGTALLYLGGEWLVSGAKGLAQRLGVSSLVIGLTVVAFATSTPELAATLTATLQGSLAVGFGNVVGSNIANIALVMGLAAILQPLAPGSRFLRREMPFMVVGSGLAAILAWDGRVVAWEGGVLLVLLAVFLAYLLLRGEEEMGEPGEGAGGGREAEEAAPTVLRGVTLVALGVVLLVVGAKAMVHGAVTLARALGIAERVIGLTLVAVGTSLPEVAATIVAVVRREGDIVLGNLVGSNIFNLLFVLAVATLVTPIEVDPSGARVDLVVMVGVSLLAWPLLAVRARVGRWEGAILVAVYVGYVTWLFS